MDEWMHFSFYFCRWAGASFPAANYELCQKCLKSRGGWSQTESTATLLREVEPLQLPETQGGLFSAYKSNPRKKWLLHAFQTDQKIKSILWLSFLNQYFLLKRRDASQHLVIHLFLICWCLSAQTVTHRGHFFLHAKLEKKKGLMWWQTHKLRTKCCCWIWRECYIRSGQLAAPCTEWTSQLTPVETRAEHSVLSSHQRSHLRAPLPITSCHIKYLCWHGS